MKTQTPHSNRTRARLTTSTLLLAALFAAMLVSSLPQPAQASRASRSYGWPVAPFDRQHPIRGSFGDPRTIFNAPPTRVGLYHGAGSFSFHQGIDVSALDGTAVYAVADGVVSCAHTDKVIVDSGSGNRFEYWHVGPAVRPGDRVTAERTVLGHILRGAGHVHLTEIDNGRVANPLQPGHLTPYRDTTAPEVAAIQFRPAAADDAPALMPNFLRGTVQMTIEAYDTTTLPVPGEWNGMPVTPSYVSWRVETWNGKVRVPETTAWDVRTTLPSNDAFWTHYARGTFQNMSVFGKHFSWLQPGCFVFRLGSLQTRNLADSVYRLVVTVTDERGNHSSSAVRFSVHNSPGWVGA
jgi:hypothetical protein